jgi:hypothetical protein
LAGLKTELVSATSLNPPPPSPPHTHTTHTHHTPDRRVIRVRLLTPPPPPSLPLQTTVQARLARSLVSAKRAAAEELGLLKAAAERHATVQGAMQAANRERDMVIGKLRETSAAKRQAEAAAAGVAAELKVQKRKATTHAKILKRLRDKYDEAGSLIAKSKGRDAVLAKLRAQVTAQADEASEARTREQQQLAELGTLRQERVAQGAEVFHLQAQRDAAAGEAIELRVEVDAIQGELRALSPQLSKYAGDAGGAEVGAKPQYTHARAQTNTLAAPLLFSTCMSLVRLQCGDEEVRAFPETRGCVHSPFHHKKRSQYIIMIADPPPPPLLHRRSCWSARSPRPSLRPNFGPRTRNETLLSPKQGHPSTVPSKPVAPALSCGLPWPACSPKRRRGGRM